MANYGRDPDTDAVTILQDVIEANERSAAELEANIADERARLDQRAAKAAEFRKANEGLMAQLQRFKTLEIA